MLRLAFGTYIQAAVLEHIVRSVTQLVSGDYPKSSTYQSECLAGTTCCIVDPLSSDDFVLMIKTSNYAVASHIIATLRETRFSDIACRDSGHFCHRLCDEIEREAATADAESLTPYSKLKGLLSVEDGSESTLTHTCIFSSSYSTFAYSSEDGAIEKIFGQVGIRGVGDVRPGMRQAAKDVVELLLNSLPVRTIDKKGVGDDCDYLLAGKHDLQFSLDDKKVEFSGPVVETKELVRAFSRFFGTKLGKGQRDSGLYDIVTNLLVPHPKISKRGLHSDYAVILRICAEKLKKKFSVESRIIPPETQEAIGLSAATSARMQRLYSEFTIALENPLFFDSIIDLLDAFHALKLLVSKYAIQAIVAARASERVSLQSRIRAHIIDTLESLKSSFYLRMERASSKRDEKNLRVEVKGSLNNLISCVDVPLKVCLGVFRFSIANAERENPEDVKRRFHDPRFKELFGGVIAAELNSRTTASWLTFEREHCSTTFLVKMDISHLFQQDLFTRIFHETGHLLFSVWVCNSFNSLQTVVRPFGFRDPKNIELSNQVMGRASSKAGLIHQKNLMTWLQEIFSELFTHLTVFENDAKRYALHYFRDFKSVESELEIPGQLWKSRRSTIDFVFRAYVVVQLGLELGCHDSPKNFSRGFVAFMKEHCESIPFERGVAQRLVGTDTGVEFVRQIAELQFPRFQMAKRVLLPTLTKILKDYRNGRESVADLRKVIEESFVERNCEPAVDVMEDEFAFVCEVLRQLAIDSESEDLDQSFARFAWSSKLFWHLSTRQRFRRLSSLLDESEL